MAPTSTIFNSNVQNHSDGESDETPYATPTFLPVSVVRRSTTPSYTKFSSSSTSTTPYTSPLHLKGIPFSWEKIPGIPKCQESHKKSSKRSILLPLPPAGTAVSATSTKTDPFLAALMECSKDEVDHDLVDRATSFKNFITRTLSDRFGLVSMYGSCKLGGCAVSESAIVYLPRSATPHYHFNRRST